MEIKIGDILLLGGDSDYKLSPPVSGLESPAYRVGDGLYAGRDGGFISGHFYGHRTLVLKGFYIGEDCENAAELGQMLVYYLQIRKDLPILVTWNNGDQYYTEGRITDIKSDIENLVAGEFQITLLCPDPILYKAEDGEVVWNEKTLGSSTVVGNDGDLEAYPIITITGATNGIKLINTTSELLMQIDVETEEDDVVVIDMGKRIITLNDKAINETRTLSSSWWGLLLEDNEIELALDGAATATIKWREGYSGI